MLDLSNNFQWTMLVDDTLLDGFGATTIGWVRKISVTTLNPIQMRSRSR